VALIEAIRSTGAEITDILIPVEKNKGKDLVFEKTGLRVKTLVKVSVADGKVRCSIC
jgi:orotate phosphoribosyltransferase